MLFRRIPISHLDAQKSKQMGVALRPVSSQFWPEQSQGGRADLVSPE